MLQGNLKYDQIFIKKNKYDIIRFFLFNNYNNVGGEIGRTKEKMPRSYEVLFQPLRHPFLQAGRQWPWD